MWKWFARTSFLAMAALPSVVQAQYPSGYYQPYGNRNYPQQWSAPAAQISAWPVASRTQETKAVVPAGAQTPAMAPIPLPPVIDRSPIQLVGEKKIVEAPVPELISPDIAPRLITPDDAKPATPLLSLPSTRPATPVEPMPPVTSKPATTKSDATPVKTKPSIEPMPAATKTSAPIMPLPAASKPASVTTTVAQPKDKGKEKPVPATEELMAPTFVLGSDSGHHGNNNCKRGFSIFAEYLYWNVHGADVPYAQPFDGVDPFLSVPRGPVAVVSPRYDHGFRIGGGMGVGDASYVVARFTYFANHRQSETQAGDGLVLHNFLAFPNTVNSQPDSLSASAEYKIRLLVGDIDFKQTIISNDCVGLYWIMGGRYAHIDQNITSTFQLLGTTTVDSSINFDGFGPRFGLDGAYHVRGGFYGYAQGFVDLLFGQFRGNYRQDNVFTGLVGLTSINSNRIVPVLELELGGGWQSESGRFSLSGGYYVGAWFNTVTTSSFAQAIGNTNFTTNGNNFRDSLIFDGFVLRAEFRY